MIDELARLRADLEVFERHGLVAEATFMRNKIAHLEAEKADPWREAKGWLSSWRGQGDYPVIVSYIDHLTARVAELEAAKATEDEIADDYYNVCEAAKQDDDPILDPARVLVTAETMGWGKVMPDGMVIKPSNAKPYRLKEASE